jgi:hypothetical protein
MKLVAISASVFEHEQQGYLAGVARSPASRFVREIYVPASFKSVYLCRGQGDDAKAGARSTNHHCPPISGPLREAAMAMV